MGKKIKKVLLNYFKTQFWLIVLTIILVAVLMFFIPNIHPIFEALIAATSYLIISQIMDYFISPYILGKTSKISPLLLILSFIIGITFFGIFGAFIAVPTALVIKTIWEYDKSNEK